MASTHFSCESATFPLWQARHLAKPPWCEMRRCLAVKRCSQERSQDTQDWPEVIRERPGDSQQHRVSVFPPKTVCNPSKWVCLGTEVEAEQLTCSTSEDMSTIHHFQRADALVASLTSRASADGCPPPQAHRTRMTYLHPCTT